MIGKVGEHNIFAFWTTVSIWVEAGYRLSFHLKEALGLVFHHHDAGEDARAAAEVVLKAEQRLAKTIEEITGKTAHLQLSFAF